MQNSGLKWLALVLTVLPLGSVVWGQTDGNQSTQAQKVELRDSSGRVRAELAVLEGEPALRFFDPDGETESLLNGHEFTVFASGGGDNAAIYAKDHVELGDGHGKTFFTVRVIEDKAAIVRLHDYRTGADVGITAQEVEKLLHPKNP